MERDFCLLTVMVGNRCGDGSKESRLRWTSGLTLSWQNYVRESNGTPFLELSVARCIQSLTCLATRLRAVCSLDHDRPLHFYTGEMIFRVSFIPRKRYAWLE